MSDTTQFDLKATKLKPSLEIAFAEHKAWGYKSTPEKLTFAWHEAAGEGFVPFVTPVGADQAEDIVQNWCREVAAYDTEPDNDGHSSRSWRIYCDYWGFVDGNHYAFAAVEPYWAEYGK